MNEKIYKLSEAVKKRRPVLAGVLNQYEELSIDKYASKFHDKETSNRKVIQDNSDFIEICTKYVEKLCGNDSADKIRKRFIDRNDILTANHHGATYCNIQIQGTLLYALSENPDSVVPSFAFGDIPLNNSTYPRGINLAGRVKIPLFSDSKKNSLVSFVDSFTKTDVEKALKKATSFFKQKKLSEEEFNTVCKILSVYSSESVLSCSSYSEQSILLNEQLWNLIFKNRKDALLPEMICFEIEKIVSELLKLDLNNDCSLIYKMFFDSQLREYLLSELDEKYGCWTLHSLEALLNSENEIDSKERHNKKRMLAAGSGTVFFWGIDSKKRRIPLSLLNLADGLYLTGFSDSGDEFKLKFTPDKLLEGMSENKLLPSLFTCFTAIAFARGYKCYGGFMQVDYLTAMRNGIAKSLNKMDLTNWADIVSSIKTNGFCTGPHFILKKHSDNKLYPAGVLDLISKGGLTCNEIDKIKEIQLNDTFNLSLSEMYPAVYRKNEREEILEDVTIDYTASVLGERKFVVIE